MGPSAAEFDLPNSLLYRLSSLLGGIFVLSLPLVVISAVRTWARWRARDDAYKYTVLSVWVLTLFFAPFLQVAGDGRIHPKTWSSPSRRGSWPSALYLTGR